MTFEKQQFSVKTYNILFKMLNPELYAKWNQMQRCGARELIEEYKTKLAWRADGNDSWIDVGCASGDITADFILPILPPNFERLIGIDISEQMIAYAREKYSQPKVEFKQFDLTDPNIQQLSAVDHISSFYCLQMIPDQKAAVQNIYNLLKPGGDCLLLFSVHAPFVYTFKELARHPKWAKYMKDYKNSISPFFNAENSMADFENLLKGHKFSNYHIESRELYFDFDGIDYFKNYLNALNPFYERIPASERDAYSEECVRLTIDFITSETESERFGKKQIRFPYRNVVVYAKK